jgi:hypothetical protein
MRVRWVSANWEFAVIVDCSFGCDARFYSRLSATGMSGRLHIGLLLNAEHHRMARRLTAALWHQLTEDITTSMREWPIQHPKATLREIETELDAPRARLPACGKTWRSRPPRPPGSTPLDSLPAPVRSAAPDRNAAPIGLFYWPTAGTISHSTGAMASARPAQAGFSPLDDELGLLPGQRTPRLHEGLVRLSSHSPWFAKAAIEFAFWTPLDVDRTTACPITAAAGTPALALVTAAVNHLLQTHRLPPPGPDKLLLSLDAARAALVQGQSAQARRLALGQPGLTTTRHAQELVQTTARSYFSRLTNRTSFGELASLAIARRGVETAGRVGAVVDRGECCQSLIDLQAPQALGSLDFPQAAE